MATKANKVAIYSGKASTSLRLDIDLKQRVETKLQSLKYGPDKTTLHGAIHEGLELWLSNFSTGTGSTKPGPEGKSAVLLKDQLPYTISLFRDKLAGLPRDFDKIVGELQNGGTAGGAIPPDKDPNIPAKAGQILGSKDSRDRRGEDTDRTTSKRLKGGTRPASGLGGTGKSA